MECPYEEEVTVLQQMLRTCLPSAPPTVHTTRMLQLSCSHPHPQQLPLPHPHPTTLCSGPVRENRFTACQLGPPHSPDYFDQFTHVDMVWDKELGLVQHW